MIEGDGVDTITRVILMECVKTERENEGQRWMINKGVDTNYSNKPKLKLSIFYVSISLFHNDVQRFVITNL